MAAGDAPPAVRRTSHVDMVFGDAGGLVLLGDARDVVLRADGAEVEHERASVRAELGRDRSLVRIEPREAEPLLGARVGSGFRAAVDAILPDHRARSSPLYLLLDDLPVAALISGYAALYSGRLPTEGLAGDVVKADICSGWRSDGTMVVSLRTRGVMPVPHGPPAPPAGSEADGVGWPPMPALGPGSMRRQRLVEVHPDVPHARVRATFRDTHADDEGAVTVLHEYAVGARYDPDTGTFHDCAARPVVLPWPECTPAADSAARLDGHRADELRGLVRDQLRGVGTCTHLNDLLRSLADVPALHRLAG